MFGNSRRSALRPGCMTWRASPAGFLVLECGRDLNALARYFRGGTAVEQFVGRERNQRACLRQLVRNAVVSRRVNSTVRALRFLKPAADCEAVRNRMWESTDYLPTQGQL
jgi:hypothetical protein